MLTAVGAPPRRPPLQGVAQIVRFNWPQYAAAGALLVLAALLLAAGGAEAPVRLAATIAVGLAGFWVVSSLAVSWFVYDLSPLMQGTWTTGMLGFTPSAWLTIHAGFDEWTPILRSVFGTLGRSLDIFDARVMSEPSIARARRRSPLRAEPGDFRCLPVETSAADAAFLMFSAHELRSHDDRCVLLCEVRRALAPSGRLIVAEHLRDAANFVAFGPGFVHFHAHRTWLRAFEDSGFELLAERRITPFVRVFVLRRP